MSQNQQLSTQQPYYYTQNQPQGNQIQSIPLGNQPIFPSYQNPSADTQINPQNNCSFYPVQNNPQNQVQYLINQHNQQLQQYKYLQQIQQQQQQQHQTITPIMQTPQEQLQITNQNHAQNNYLHQQQIQIKTQNMVNSNNLNTNINHQMQPQLKIENTSNGYQITQQNQNSHNYNLNNIFVNLNSTNLTNQTQKNSVNVISNQETNQSNTNSNLLLEQQKSLFLPKQEDPKKKIDNSQSLTNLVENPNKQQAPQMEIVYQSLKSKPQQQETQKSNKKFINCLVHKDKILEQVCLSNNCLKQKICCQLCVDQSHKGHETISLDLYMNNIKELEKNIEENNGKENSNWEKIQNIFESNTKYLKELENLNVKLNSNIQKLQNSMKIIQDKQNTDSTHLKQKINTLQTICENPKQNDQLALVNEITQLVHFFQKFQSPSVFDYPQIIETIEFNQQLQAYNEQSVQDFQFYITKALEEQESLEKTFNYQEFKLLNQMKKEKNDVKLTQKLTRVFHLIKGKAKKRDIINFITWNPDHKELKFMKDIKEKEEKSHYQLVFSLFIKNLEILEYEQIDDNLMKWLTQQILNVYPSVKKEKEEQRKFISSKPSNKRRYCKFNPKFDIDIKNYLSSTLIDNSINLKISKSDKNLENSENNLSSDY